MKIKPIKSVLVLKPVSRRIVSAMLLLVAALACPADGKDAATMTMATTTIPVDSPAFVFSPGNWVGDEGRGGNVYRQTWNPGAYFRVAWESEATVAPTLLLDTSTHGEPFGAPSWPIAWMVSGAAMCLVRNRFRLKARGRLESTT